MKQKETEVNEIHEKYSLVEEKLSTKNEELAQTSHSFEEQILELQRQVDGLESVNVQLKSLSESSKESLAEKSSEIETMKRDHNLVVVELDNAKSQISELKTKNDNLIEKITSNEEKLDSINIDREGLEEQLSNRTLDLKQIKEAKEILEKKNNDQNEMIHQVERIVIFRVSFLIDNHHSDVIKNARI